MKTIVIGDIHGRNVWKDIVDRHQDFDRVIFLGDYFDTHEDISPKEQIANFNEICYFSTRYKGKVVMLIGNHDYHYMPITKDRYSGYNEEFAQIIGHQIKVATDLGLLQMAHEQDGMLFTHAGVSKAWIDREVPNSPGRMADEVNNLWKRYPAMFGFFYGDTSGHGDHPLQGPLWIRPDSLMAYPIKEYIQVVGHTMMKTLTETFDHFIFMDTLGTSGEYLEITNGYYRPLKI